MIGPAAPRPARWRRQVAGILRVERPATSVPLSMVPAARIAAGWAGRVKAGRHIAAPIAGRWPTRRPG
jgi:hypothetical protein